MLEEVGMMMVPSSYILRSQESEKQRHSRRSSSKSTSRPSISPDKRSAIPSSTKTASTSPVRIPSQKKGRDAAPKPKQYRGRQESHIILEPERAASISRSFSTISVEALLSETSIPVRRKPKQRRSQRLPAGDHVIDFSRLLLEDLSTKDDVSFSTSLSNPQLDILFGGNGESMEDGMFVGSEGATPQGMSVRSMSTESMPSVTVDGSSAGTSYSEATTPSPYFSRRGSYRKARVISSSEDCAENHPLSPQSGHKSRKHAQAAADLGRWSPEVKSNSQTQTSPAPKQKSSFRSNLTSSLRALQSAASSISSFAASGPINRPDDFLTRSLFTFSPELTDDRRPPPSASPPSPALRRYLNPDLGSIEHPQTSGSELYSYSDLPSPKSPSTLPDVPQLRRRFPASIQLQTYLPPATRSSTGSASSPPRFGSPTPAKGRRSSSPNPEVSMEEMGEDLHNSDELIYNAHTSFHAAPTLVRQREPRENPDFLRIVVCEMQMRRNGKFVDNIEGRAMAWLPPRRERPVATRGPNRWTGWVAEDY